MLQVARLSPTQLGESSDLVEAFLRDRLNADGGFQDRAGDSDLYYTVFGLDGLIALQLPLPDSASAFLGRSVIARTGFRPCVVPGAGLGHAATASGHASHRHHPRQD